MLRPLLLALVFAMTAPAAHAADPAAGELVFKKRCFVCHAVGEGAANKQGPELNGLFGRPAGSVAGYPYSKANKESGIVWDEAIFATYIRNPKQTVPGTKMAFPGLKTDQEVEDLTAYLGSFSADGAKAQ
jgi:cytochrome c